MEYLKKATQDGKKALYRIRNGIEYYDLNIPYLPCWEDIIEQLIYISGYIDCLENNNLIKEMHERDNKGIEK